MRIVSKVRRTICTGVLTIVAGVACASPDLSGPVSIDPAQLVWTLSLSAHAITMSTAAPYNTLQITAVPRTIDGSVLAGAPAVKFRTTDSSLRVSSTGLLTARNVRNNVRVIATIVYRGVRLFDTANVNITAETNPPAFHAFHFQLPDGETTDVPPPNDLVGDQYFQASKTFEIEARDGSDSKIANSLVAIAISDPSQAKLNNIFGPSRATTAASSVKVFTLSGSRSGTRFYVRASATVYGVTFEDSIQLHITNPLFFLYTVTKTTAAGSTTPTYNLLPYQQTTIGVGGYVWWLNHISAADSLDIVFDNPADVSADLLYGSGGGNIPPFAGDTDPLQTPDYTVFIRSRQFLKAETFHWHSVRTGISGTIIVK